MRPTACTRLVGVCAFSGSFLASSFSCSQAESQPTQNPLTPAVGRPVVKSELIELNGHAKNNKLSQQSSKIESPLWLDGNNLFVVDNFNQGNPLGRRKYCG